MKLVEDLRRIPRALLDSRSGRPLRDLAFRRLAKREQLRSHCETEFLFGREGRQFSQWSDVFQKKNGVLFILGSGASVASLDEEDFKEFSHGFTVGINTWVLHPFIPDAYTYEYDPDPRLLQFLARERVLESKPAILMLRPRGSHEYGNYRQLPSELRQRSVVYGRTNLVTRRTGEIWRDFETSIDWLSRHREFVVLPDNGATVARMVSAGVLQGFHRIILVGVDLIGTDYFWHRNSELIAHLGLSGWRTGQFGFQHETLTAVTRPFGIDEWLYAVGEGLRSQGVSLEVWSNSSLLAQKLPLSPESRH